jgi:hypothetical protein
LSCRPRRRATVATMPTMIAIATESLRSTCILALSIAASLAAAPAFPRQQGNTQLKGGDGRVDRPKPAKCDQWPQTIFQLERLVKKVRISRPGLTRLPVWMQVNTTLRL